MRARLVVFLILGVSAVLALITARQMIMTRGLPREPFVDKKLRLLTYATFVGANGPGEYLTKDFQKDCGCKVEITAVTDAGMLLERLKMARFDVVVGLDQLMLANARKNFAWQTLTAEGVEWNPAIAEFADSEFVPFDWSPMSFVYRKGPGKVPQKFDELLDPGYRKQFAVQDPHASSPGMQFYNWVADLKGAGTVEFLGKFKENVFSVSPSWAFAYGLFKKNQVKFVFSYLTSLAYHWSVDNDRSFQVLSFPEGHPVQVELAAVPASCKECELGAEFVQHLLQPESQLIIMTRNYMLPVLKSVEQGSVFAELPQLKVLKTTTGEKSEAKDFHDWDQIFN